MDSGPASEAFEELLLRYKSGDRDAAESVFSQTYGELRAIARSLMTHERDGHTLQTTALVNEACIRLLGLNRTNWIDRTQFLRVAARAMRRVLIDHARARASAKRGGGAVVSREASNEEDVQIEAIAAEGAAFFAYPALDLIALDVALDHLSTYHERKARVVELLFFGGLSVTDTARVLEVTRRTVERDWGFARLWLIRSMSESDPSGSA